VKSGPQILTLKREHRDLVVPSMPNGKIMYVDFAALEARVLLYEAGGQCSDVDLYGMIARDLFGGTVSRDAVKLAVISELYGSGKHTLGETLQISGDPLDRFIAKIKGFFKTNDLKARVKDQYVKLGYIRNRHGRMVKIDEPIDRIFVNSYAQSTGVDVSLLGFNELLKSLKHTKCRPLFVLHDALIVDVPEESVDELMQIESVKVPGYVQSFKLKVQMM
jgi:DNA polymerase I-like protein with 3'-5' exonuclease and polymerase domains